MKQKNKLVVLLSVLSLTVMFSGCLKEHGDTIILPEMYDEVPETLLPTYLVDSLTAHNVDIYRGNTPPNIEGEYLWSIVKMQYSSDGATMDNFADCYMKISGQNSRNLCVYYEEQADARTRCDSAMIFGHGNLFTFVGKVTSVHSDNVTTAVVGTLFSGRISSSGITDYTYSIYMIDKYDPDNTLMDVGTFRTFYDSDGLVDRYQWYNSKGMPACSGDGLISLFARKEAAQ